MDNKTKTALDALADLKHLVDEQAEDEGLGSSRRPRQRLTCSRN